MLVHLSYGDVDVNLQRKVGRGVFGCVEGDLNPQPFVLTTKAQPLSYLREVTLVVAAAEWWAVTGLNRPLRVFSPPLNRLS